MLPVTAVKSTVPVRAWDRYSQNVTEESLVWVLYIQYIYLVWSIVLIPKEDEDGDKGLKLNKERG